MSLVRLSADFMHLLPRAPQTEGFWETALLVTEDFHMARNRCTGAEEHSSSSAQSSHGRRATETH